jgi:hypothetical protein
MKKGKVQTNQYGVNVLVEHEDGNNRHYSHLDFPVLCEKLSEEEIDKAFDKITLTTKDKIDFLKKINGFAVSDVRAPKIGAKPNDLFRFERIKS